MDANEIYERAKIKGIKYMGTYEQIRQAQPDRLNVLQDMVQADMVKVQEIIDLHYPDQYFLPKNIGRVFKTKRYFRIGLGNNDSPVHIFKIN